ncbi:MAG: GNAT family N-acetyltransferase [Marinicellaceae bacterium]
MVKIEKAQIEDLEVIALLGRLTWYESHGPYVEDKNDVTKYLNENFSISTTTNNIKNPNIQYYIVYVDDLPAGYAKIVLNKPQENIESLKNCQLERIFILNEFIPLRIGQKLMSYVEEQAKELRLDTMWLSVYIKNKRAIRFYERNDYKNVGELNFSVNDKLYENTVFAKSLVA